MQDSSFNFASVLIVLGAVQEYSSEVAFLLKGKISKRWLAVLLSLHFLEYGASIEGFGFGGLTPRNTRLNLPKCLTATFYLNHKSVILYNFSERKDLIL